MPSLRQYATAAAISQITGLKATDITDELINQAESMIDDECAEFYQDSFAKGMNRTLRFEASQATFSTNSMVLTPGGYSDNYFEYTVIEIMSGPQKGLLIPVVGSTGNILSNGPQS
jgi:hypothetical protein